MWKYLLECMENEEEVRNTLGSLLNTDFLSNGRVKKDNMILDSISRKFGVETIWHCHYRALERVS